MQLRSAGAGSATRQSRRELGGSPKGQSGTKGRKAKRSVPLASQERVDPPLSGHAVWSRRMTLSRLYCREKKRHPLRLFVVFSRAPTAFRPVHQCNYAVSSLSPQYIHYSSREVPPTGLISSPRSVLAFFDRVGRCLSSSSSSSRQLERRQLQSLVLWWPSQSHDLPLDSQESDLLWPYALHRRSHLLKTRRDSQPRRRRHVWRLVRVCEGGLHTRRMPQVVVSASFLVSILAQSHIHKHGMACRPCGYE